MTTASKREQSRYGFAWRKRAAAARFAFSLIAILVASHLTFSQEAVPVSTFDWPVAGEDAGRADSGVSPGSATEKFRVEKIRVPGGSELITIFARVNGLNASGTEEPFSEVPMVSFLRDTLGDSIAENDRLRYFWVLSSTDPSFKQKAAAAVPFLYSRVGNKKGAGSSPPKPVLDINPVGQEVWDQVLFTAFKKLVIEDFAVAVKLPFYQYRRNTRDYRRASIAQALALLSVYQGMQGDEVLGASEMSEIKARLLLSEKTLGSFVDRNNYSRLVQSDTQKELGVRGVNWELLRQRCESEGLYFEPLKMPDGSSSHVLVWVDEADVEKKWGESFDKRLLNIKNPWTDPKLLKWEGYSEDRWYDEENRKVPEGTPGATKRRMIPIALYGLNFPKIPALLIDFRSSWNAKSREMSKRILNDITKDLLSISALQNPAILVGRFLADFAVRRRGLDIMQDSRISAYSELKLLILLSESIDPEFKSEIAGRAEDVSLNPLQNDIRAEIKLARQQYRNLIEHAEDPDGLQKRIRKDRSREMVRLKHNGTERFFFNLGRIVTFGMYEHVEKWTPELAARMDLARQLNFHEKNLQAIARDSIDPEIDSDEESLKDSLEFIASEGLKTKKKTTEAISKIFTKSKDVEVKNLSLLALYRINSPSAIKQMMAFYQDKSLSPDLRKECARYLEMAASGNGNISRELSQEILGVLED